MTWKFDWWNSGCAFEYLSTSIFSLLIELGEQHVHDASDYFISSEKIIKHILFLKILDPNF